MHCHMKKAQTTQVCIQRYAVWKTAQLNVRPPSAKQSNEWVLNSLLHMFTPGGTATIMMHNHSRKLCNSYMTGACNMVLKPTLISHEIVVIFDRERQ